MKTDKSLIDLCLGSPVKIRILSTLSAWKGKDITELQLASLSHISDFGVRHALGELAGSGIVTKKVVGRANVWSLNESSYAYDCLGPIVDQIRKIPSPLSFLKDQILSIPKEKIEKIILFGSAIRLAFQEIGDIDIAVILKKKGGLPEKKRIEEVLGGVSGVIGMKLGKRLEPHVFTTDEWNKIKGKPLGTNIQRGKEIYPHEED